MALSTAPPPSIARLEEVVAGLRPQSRAAFERIFRVDVSTGKLAPPGAMLPWIRRQFGSVDEVREQRIVKVTNVVTMEGALFNALRSSRPMIRSSLDLKRELRAEEPLDRPYELTPEDLFGRVQGESCVTASNVAKFDGFHGLVVFDRKDPLRFSRAQVHDYFATGERWARRAHRSDPAAKYYLFLWNCLWRAGASLMHGHAQVLLGRGMHYAAVERLRRTAAAFRRRTGDDYFDALFRAHETVGAGFRRRGVRVMANLAPVKENEVVLLASRMSGPLIDAAYDVLAFFRRRLGVRAFNLVVYRPPLAPARESWKGFPMMIRIVDRGDLGARTSDIAAMELYAASVVAGDPLRLARRLRDSLPNADS